MRIAAALTLACAGLAGCAPVEEPICGNPSTLLETTTRAVEGDRITTRTTRAGTGGNSGVLRVEAADGRLMTLTENPPRLGAPAGTAVRAVTMGYDDDDRLVGATVAHLDDSGRALGQWQVALGYADDGRIARIEAAGQPVGDALARVLGPILPGPSDGELNWLPPLPGADLLGPLPADITALQRSRVPGLPLFMAADVVPIEGGLRANWVVGGDDIQVALPVEHVDTATGWIRTWVGDRDLQSVSLGWSRDADVPGDGVLIWRLDGAEYERIDIGTEAIAGGTRRTQTVRRDGQTVYRRVVEVIDDTTEERTDANGDGIDDEIRVLLPAGEGRSIEVIDQPPLGPVDLYRFTEIDGETVRVHAVAPDSGQQLCAVDGGPVVLAGEPGARRVEGVPEALPDPPPN